MMKNSAIAAVTILVLSVVLGAGCLSSDQFSSDNVATTKPGNVVTAHDALIESLAQQYKTSIAGGFDLKSWNEKWLDNDPKSGTYWPTGSLKSISFNAAERDDPSVEYNIKTDIMKFSSSSEANDFILHSGESWHGFSASTLSTCTQVDPSFQRIMGYSLYEQVAGKEPSFFACYYSVTQVTPYSLAIYTFVQTDDIVIYSSPIKADYSGGSVSSPFHSGPRTQNSSPAPSPTSMGESRPTLTFSPMLSTANALRVKQGDAVTWVFSLTDSNGVSIGSTAGKWINFYIDDEAAKGVWTPTPEAKLIYSGSETMSLLPGVHTLKADFLGDETSAPSQYVLTFTVTPAATITPIPTYIPVTPTPVPTATPSATPTPEFPPVLIPSVLL